ncbi:MAG: CDP-archaeol synthase [Methylococcales bacterium]|nr:CDP-archaeol synthase [Methylococcaceae bacterium]
MLEWSYSQIDIVRSLILLLAANGAPVLAVLVFGKHWNWPIDGGLILRDGRHLFGHSKTWRGLLAAIVLTALVAFILSINLWTGALFGLLAMLGDCLSSFIKRRLGYPTSSHARGLDTLTESILPTLLLKQSLGINWADILWLALIFFLLEEFVSPLLYQWHIRNRPY